jgi:hypothetical protein
MFISLQNFAVNNQYEGFWKSKATVNGKRISYWFHPDEIHILAKRLLRLNNDFSLVWYEDIKNLVEGKQQDCTHPFPEYN